jgi:hypothetical protein
MKKTIFMGLIIGTIVTGMIVPVNWGVPVMADRNQ